LFHSEDDIALAILRLVEIEKAVVEGAGATGLAACLSGKLDAFKGKNVVVILSGGNIDTTVLGRCLDRGLAADGRLVRLSIVVSDRPGGLKGLIEFLYDQRVSVKDIIHERTWLKGSIFNVEVECVVETRGKEHAEKLRLAALNKYGRDFIKWGGHNINGDSDYPAS
jgi:threonine dehydratase